MTITITGCRYTPKWETLEGIVRESTERAGKLVRISRSDRGCNYRAPGFYELDYLTADDELLLINFECKG